MQGPRWMGCVGVVLVAAAGCSGSDGPEVDVPSLIAATDAYCALEACRYDLSVSECGFYAPLDFLNYAFLSEDPARCIDRSIDLLQCSAAAAPMCDSACPEESDAVETACAEVSDPTVDPFFDGEAEICTHLTDCTFPDLDAGDPDYDFEYANCLAVQGARYLIVKERYGSACSDKLAAMLRCFTDANLSCTAGGDEEAAACPDDVAAYRDCSAG